MSSVRLGIRLGMTVAVGISLIAIVLSAAGAENVFGAIHRTMVGGVTAYCVIGLVLGALGGALRPLFQSTVGTSAAGALLGMLGYVFFKLADPTRPAWDWSDAIGAAAFCSIGVGVAVASRARLRARAERDS